MTRGLTKLHLAKVIIMLVLLAAIVVMLSDAPERYVYGGL